MNKEHTIWKYTIDLTGEIIREGSLCYSIIEMPKNAKFRAATCIDAKIFLWFEVNPEADKKPRRLYVCGTGHPVPDKEQYLSTVIMGAFVWHIYEGAHVEKETNVEESTNVEDAHIWIKTINMEERCTLPEVVCCQSAMTPGNAKFKKASCVGTKIFLWFEHNPEALMTWRKFYFYGPNDSLAPVQQEYLATVTMEQEPWRIYISTDN